MKGIILSTLLLLLFGAISNCYSQEAITNIDIISMKNSKLSESLILAKITSSNCDFDLQTPKIVELKDSKLSVRLIKQMISSSREKPNIDNEFVIDLKKEKIPDEITLHLISNCPHNFITTPEELIKLNSAKISKRIIKEMMNNPVKGSQVTQTVNSPSKGKGTDEVSDFGKNNSPGCRPFETTDLETNEKVILYGAEFNSGGVLGAIAGNAENSKESMLVMAGFIGDKTIVNFQLNRIVGEKWRNKNNLRDLFIKKGEKVSVITDKGNIPFSAMEEAHSDYKNEGSGLSGRQERVSIHAACLATKSQIIELMNAEVKGVYLILTNGNAVTVKPSKGDLKRFKQQLTCLVGTEKFKNSPESSTVELTSDEAISELKKAKDKLDLGLISQQEYDSIKAKLIKFIK